jgi:ribosome modulation factor
MQPFGLGFKAGILGCDPRECPYATMTMEWAEWQRGQAIGVKLGDADVCPLAQTAKPPYPDAERDRLILSLARNWVCDNCCHAWWEADAYHCPACGQSHMHLWGERDHER